MYKYISICSCIAVLVYRLLCYVIFDDCLIWSFAVPFLCTHFAHIARQSAKLLCAVSALFHSTALICVSKLIFESLLICVECLLCCLLCTSSAPVLHQYYLKANM